jgi:hypothetical protein
MKMPRIVKDYKNRQRAPIMSSPPNVAADEAKMSGNSGSGSQQSNTEAMITHQKAVLDRAKRHNVPNSRLRAK